MTTQQILVWKDTLKKVSEIIQKAKDSTVCYCVDYDIPSNIKVKEGMITVSGKTFVVRFKISSIKLYENQQGCIFKKKDNPRTCIEISKAEEIQEDIVKYEELSGMSIEKIDTYSILRPKEEIKIELKENPLDKLDPEVKSTHDLALKIGYNLPINICKDLVTVKKKYNVSEKDYHELIKATAEKYMENLVIERGKDNSFISRDEFYHPIILRDAELGQKVTVKIINSTPFYLIGENGQE